MSGSAPHAAGTKTDHIGRRTWDKEYFERKALARGALEDGEEIEPEHDHPAFKLPRKPLQARTERINLEHKLGKTNVITDATPLEERGGYYCETCDCSIRDSANWLDHINGKKHLRALGISVRPERSTLEQVREKFKEAKRKKMEPKTPRKSDYDLGERVEALQKEEAEQKRDKKRKKKERKRKQKQQEQQELVAQNPESDLLAQMGLPTGFG